MPGKDSERLDRLFKWSQIFSVLIQFAIACLAGIWAYYWHWTTKEYAMDPGLKVLTTIQPYDSKNDCLIVRVRLSNAGKIPIGLNEGSSLYVIVSEIPANLATSQMLRRFDFQHIAKSDNILKTHASYNIPGHAQYDELRLVVLPPGKYYVYAELDWTDEGQYEVDDATVVDLAPPISFAQAK